MKAVAIVAVLVLAACATARTERHEDARGDLIETTGTVLWRDVEGGSYVIKSEDGTTYDPVNLPNEFREAGLRVYFEARRRPDLMSQRMVGVLVEIVAMRKVEGAGNDPPPHAHLNPYGNGWDCDSGYARAGSGCRNWLLAQRTNAC